MARKRNHRLIMEGTLQARTPLHVGGMRDSVETDLPLACDGQGRWYVPGTSLAGPLRAWVSDAFADGPALAEQWFGFQAGQGDDGRASHVVVEDAPLTLPSDLGPEIWDGVGIDRQWGSAAEGVKYDRAILPAGTTFPLRLTVELPPVGPDQTAPWAAPAAARSLLGRLLQALEQGQIGFGAAKTRGLGSVVLRSENLRIAEEDWSSPQGVLDLLQNRRKTLDTQALVLAAPALAMRRRRRLTFKIHWRPAGPVMVKAGYEGVTVDMLPMLSGGESGKLGLVLPGSSVKGALRSQAERIVRTVIGVDPRSDWSHLAPRERHAAQVDVPLVRELFGVAKKSPRAGATEPLVEPSLATDGRGRRGALAVATCYATNLPLEPHRWLAHTTTTPADDARRQLPYLEPAYHVAIDRWTGGAADNFLYSTLEPFGVAWEPLMLTVDLETLASRAPAASVEEAALDQSNAARQGEEFCQAAVFLLALLVRDLAMTRIPVGFAGNRGYGSIQVTRMELEVEGVPELRDGELARLENGVFCGVADLSACETAWRNWIDTVKGNRQ